METIVVGEIFVHRWEGVPSFRVRCLFDLFNIYAEDYSCSD